MTTRTMPRVWWGCLQCYNEGRLEGEWVNLPLGLTRNQWWKRLNTVSDEHRARHLAIDGWMYGDHEEWMALDNDMGMSTEFIQEIFDELERGRRTGDERWLWN